MGQKAERRKREAAERQEEEAAERQYKEAERKGGEDARKTSSRAYRKQLKAEEKSCGESRVYVCNSSSVLPHGWYQLIHMIMDQLPSTAPWVYINTWQFAQFDRQSDIAISVLTEFVDGLGVAVMILPILRKRQDTFVST